MKLILAATCLPCWGIWHILEQRSCNTSHMPWCAGGLGLSHEALRLPWRECEYEEPLPGGEGRSRGREWGAFVTIGSGREQVGKRDLENICPGITKD